MQMLGLNPTTPFGSRALSMTALRVQRDVQNCPNGKAIHKWKTFRYVCEAKAELGLSDRALTILNALLSFHPDTVLTLGTPDLVVFPSNRELALRAHGIPVSTLRRHLAGLVDTGLILRRDSPNGKRYARKAATGDIEQAFGFDLSPLIARANELARRATAVVTERRTVDMLREQITLARRDIAKMIAAGVEQEIIADWEALHRAFRELLDRLPRVPSRPALEPVAIELIALSRRILSVLEQQVESACEHSASSEPSASEANAESPVIDGVSRSADLSKAHSETAPGVPVRLVAETCPDFVDYARHGLRTERDIVDTAAIVRPLLGVSPSAWEEACITMGHGRAGVAVALILQRGAAIRNPGGYLRTLTRRASAGQFSVWPMLMALGRSRRQRPTTQAGMPAFSSFPEETS